ncbi:MAG: VWA domain-containing protein [Pirellulales bacterium]|nr:VWA domain-containing protein [Pirellulales bacterium]
MQRTLSHLEESVSAGSQNDPGAGFGALETQRGALPLVALSVRTSIAGLVAHTSVRQRFHNSLQEPLEATYVFPLPDRAAVTSFRLEVAGRVIEGELKERSEAREEYAKAIEAGHRAAIAEEDRSGVFSLRVGNIPAGQEIAVQLTLVGPLPVADGEATFRFPLVVAPRYISGIPLEGKQVGRGWGEDTDAVPDASRITPPVLLPGFPNPVCLSLEVELDPAGLETAESDWAGQIRSSLHSVVLNEGPPWTIRLQPGERLNRDFILRFPVAGTAVRTTLLASPGRQGEPGTFMLMLVPPAVRAQAPRASRDVVIVLDRSGSMNGWKIVAARRAAGRIIDSLLEEDRFTVVAFDNVVEYPKHARDRLVEATDRNRARALEWLGTIDARGGTEMGPALEAAVKHLAAADAPRQRIVVLVTDGQVGGEDAVLRQLQRSAGKSLPRIHTVGIDMAVNAGFLRRLADFGAGTCDLVESEDRLEAAMDGIHRAIGTPALTGLRLEGREFTWAADSLVPSRLPDLYPDRPLMLFGRFTGDASSARLRISGADAEGNAWWEEAMARSGPADMLSSLWGRAQVRELEDRYAAGTAEDPQALARRIVEVSLGSHVLSRFTAYTAVDRSEVVNPGGKQHEILQPVEAPAGWEMLASTPFVGAGHMARCLSAPSVTLDAMLMEPRESAPLSRARRVLPSLRRGSKPPASPRGLAEVVAESRAALEKVEQSLALRPKKQLKGWTRLIELLEELCNALKQAGYAAAAETERLLQRGREILEGIEAGGKQATETDAAKEHLGLVRTLMDSIQAAGQAVPDRRKFWT